MARPPCFDCDENREHCGQCGCCGDPSKLPSVGETSTPPVRGRRPGKIARGTCKACGRDVALRKSGDPFSHRRMASNGYSRLGYCNGGQR